MKKILVSLIVALMAANAKAQFIIDSIGHIGVNTYPAELYSTEMHSLTSTRGGLEIIRVPIGQQDSTYLWSLAINARAEHTKDIYSFGIRSQATNPTYLGVGRCFGVYSEACGATNGYNYGLYGVIGSQNGAGVYGSTVYDMGLGLDQRYAGYFRGPVKVQGNLTVTGNISGVVLGAPSLPTGSSTGNGTRNMVSEQLSGQLTALDVSTFYHTLPVKRSTSAVDTAEVEVPLTAMEEQILSKQHYGLDAAQLEGAFPDLVYDNEDGTKSINYVEMVPILVQAIKELKAEINELKGSNTAKKTKKATGVNAAESVQVLSLGQNKPNPFSRATDIDVSVPETVQTAFLYVYDLQGKKVQQVDITARGKQTVSVNAAELAEGMYLYSLIADGKVVETRRMIVEK